MKSLKQIITEAYNFDIKFNVRQRDLVNNYTLVEAYIYLAPDIEWETLVNFKKEFLQQVQVKAEKFGNSKQLNYRMSLKGDVHISIKSGQMKMGIFFRATGNVDSKYLK